MTENQSPQNSVSNWIPLGMAAMLAFGIWIGVKIGQRIPYILGGETSPSSVQNKYDEVLRYINARYLEDVNHDSLETPTIERILHDLDPHSSYLSLEEVQLSNDNMEGDFEGIGVEYIMVNDTMNVVSPVPNGPSDQAGIRSGDKIVAVEDPSIAGVHIKPEKLMKKIRGPKGSKVHLAIRRGNQLLDIFVVRDEIPNRSVDVGFMLDDKTGYIKVNRFSGKTYKEFMEKLDTLISQKNMKDLVIDLRGNPGGYLQEATNILNQLIKEKGRLIVYTEGKNSIKKEYKTDGRSFYDVGKIVVLIDETSASASEIMAGTLQDWDRATIIGRRTFGKGLVQEQFPLSDGSAIRLTIAQYFLPSGRCIQKPYKGLKNYENELEDRIKSGELVDAEKNKRTTKKFSTLGGREVYEGGGIYPDVFVPVETGIYDESITAIRTDLNAFVLQFANENRATFATTENEFLQQNLNENVFNAFVKYLKNKKTTIDDKKIIANKSLLNKELKARIGRVLFKDETQYKVNAINDAMIVKALEELRK